ncbi:DUF308 domain-containing protein [Streptococcus chenjunshii]|uniref:DUF308 domain-containing protein n=1 Tax=Streptococcus chenjunshii TaxID=2173853 RepID=A0A372KN71_9STRE|nr:DUF308 domain-containing protein [Streptococcus chenjunshii]AXQ78832.1 DUF308 domain-containing protein [Streptococcus chenjunshii]RFU51593.1 DUF308 domain-containing protein [Streptococcus chenjunshii]RFU53713.1 DUF308 domain-containing protein [Streptococcus chenjunshii]
MKWFPLIAGIFAILTGFYLFANPLITVASLGWFLALIVFVSGVTNLMRYFSGGRDTRSFWDLLQSILSIAFGIVLLSSSAFSLSGAVITILAYWVLLSGIFRLAAGIQLRRAGALGSSPLLFSAALTIILGLILLGQPILTAALIGRFIAVLFMGIGIQAIYTFINMR